MSTTNPPEQTVTPEDQVRIEAMKKMAKNILAVAEGIIKENHLSPEPTNTNFAWHFYGNEGGRGYHPSHSAINIQEAANTGIPRFSVELAGRVEGITDPEGIAKALQTQQLVARSLAIEFGDATDLNPRYGRDTREALVRLFVERLGFLQPNIPIYPNPAVERIGNNQFILRHPSEPFSLELNAVGQATDGGPRFTGFVIRYDPIPTQKAT